MVDQAKTTSIWQQFFEVNDLSFAARDNEIASSKLANQELLLSQPVNAENEIV